MTETIHLGGAEGTPIELNIDGDCFVDLLEDLGEDLSHGDVADLRRQAVELVERSVCSYDRAYGNGAVGAGGAGKVSQRYKPQPGAPVANGTNALLYGRVQSGKTNLTIASVALASSNGFRCFIVLTSDNTWLGQQTAQRFRDNLLGGPVVHDWTAWQRDPPQFGRQLRAEVRDTGTVLVCTKNTSHLENLIKAIRKAGIGSHPAMIVDDEADNASLNTNSARAARAKTRLQPPVDASRIFSLIGSIRRAIPNHIYLQVTATPQSLLLQGLDQPQRPAFSVISQPGAAYVGGDQLLESGSLHTVAFDSRDLAALKTGRVTAGGKPHVPAGLANAVACFLLGVAYRQTATDDRRRASYSMLVHVDHRKQQHRNALRAIQHQIREIDEAVRGKSSKSKTNRLVELLERARVELLKTEPKIPPLDVLVEWLKKRLRNAASQVIDADNPKKVPDYAPGPNVLVGGNRLGRGVTIEGLTVTYYGRDPKTRMMDTVHQHARMFGYRRELLSITRIFSAPHILEAFERIHEADTITRAAAESPDGALRITPLLVGRGIKPTRSNVLNPADVGAIVGQMQVWPHGIVPRNQDLETIEARLKPFVDRDSYYPVPTRDLVRILNLIKTEDVPGAHWQDLRMRSILQILERDLDFPAAVINVRRGLGKSKLGFRATRDKVGSGFISGQQDRFVKDTYARKPALLLRKQAGRKEDGWGGRPFYAPTLVLPSCAHAFLFVV